MRRIIPKSEQGSLLVLLALLTTVLCVFVALSVDLTTAAVSQEQAQQNAQLGALSALERYFATDDSEENKILAALERANTVATFNRTLHLKNGSSVDLTTDENDTDHPTLIPGRYYFEMPSDNVNPCTNGASPPCFAKLEAGQDANAFRVVGQLYQTLPMKFARVLEGQGSIPITVDATATVVPRRGIFLVDISGSLVRETHDPSKYLYAYRQGDVNDNNKWSNFPAGQTNRGANPTDPKVHYKDDYQAITTLGDANYTAADKKYHPSPTAIAGDAVSGPRYSATPATYSVDQFRDSIYRGPQALTTVLRGMNSAVKLFTDRAVAGDRIGAVFFASGVSWPREVKLTSDFDYLDRLTDVDVTNDPNRGLQLALKHGIFPDSSSFTNSVTALAEAMKLFKADNTHGTPTSDFVVYIGDGMSNCAPCDYNPAVERPEFDVYPPNAPDGKVDYRDWQQIGDCIEKPLTGNCSKADVDHDGQTTLNDFNAVYGAYQEWYYCETKGNCSDDYSYFQDASLMTHRIAQYSYYPARIPIHVILTGAHVAPHTIDTFNPRTGRCYTDEEVRQGPPGYPIEWVSPMDKNNQSGNFMNQFVNASETDPFYPPNWEWFKAATITGGMWLPLRPRGTAECAGYPGRIPEDQAPLCMTTSDRSFVTNRRLTDPYCRTPDEQIADYMTLIMRTNPYTLVYEKGST